MRHLGIIIFTLFLLNLLGCKSSNTGQSNSKNKTERVLPAELAAAYREDAARLAVRELMTSHSTSEVEAVIPPERIEYFFGLLSKVYWMTVDSAQIPNLSSIHTLKSPNLRRVQVILHPDAHMIDNWSKGVNTTSDLYLNQLLARYGCKIKDFRQSSAGPMCVIEADRDISTPGLAEALKHNNGIKSAEPEGIMGDGNNIEYGGEGKNQMALRFSIGTGDCPSGCIQRKLWIFYVSQEGVVTYMGTRGTIPAELEPKE